MTRTKDENIGPIKRVVAKKATKERKDDWKRKALIGIGLAAWVGAVLFGMEWLMAFIIVKILPIDALGTNTVNALYQAVTYIAALAVIVYVPKKLKKIRTSRDELGLTGLPTWTDLLLAPLVFIVVLLAAGALTAIMVALLPGVNWEQTQEVGFKGLYRFGDFAVAFICLVILAPVFEEVIFRGWLYGKIRAYMPALPAILIVSLLFGIMHGQWNVGVTVFVMSIGMCLQRELTGTIWSGIILHMIKNGIAFYFLFVV